MLIIPLHILSNERRKKILKFLNRDVSDIAHKNYISLFTRYGISPLFMNEEIIGVSNKSVINWAQKKHKPTKSKLKKFESKLKKFVLDFPGIKEENGIITDKYTTYSSIEIIKIIKSCRFVYQELLHSDKHMNSVKIIDILHGSNLPKQIIDENFPDISNNNTLHMSINSIRVEISLFIIAALFIDYSHWFFDPASYNLHIYLPSYDANNINIQLPIKNWINRTVEIYGFKSCDQFFRDTIHPNVETQTQEDNKEENKLQTGKRWKRGVNIPQKEQIKKIYQELGRRKRLDKEATTEIQAHGVYILQLIISFQNLYQTMNANPQLFYLKDNENLVNFFQRYLFWQNFHANQLKKQLKEEDCPT